MENSKMWRAEYEAEALRLKGLIDKRSEAGLQGVKELSKRQFSLQQMRDAARRHHREAAQMWKRGATSVPDKKSS